MKKVVLWGAAVAAMLPGMVMACGFEMPPSYYTQEVGKEDQSNFSLSPDHLGELKLIGDFYFPAWKNRELMGNSVKSDEAHRIDFFSAGEKLSRPREEVKAAWKKYQKFARACDSVIREHPLLTERSSKDIPEDAGIYREFYLYTLGRMQYCILPSRELPPAWKELMALPPASRHYRTVWVKFMELMAQEEYEAWHDLNDARFNLWNDVSYTREWYSMKPLEIEGYYTNLSENRRAELDVERDIILNGKIYRQKGETVTAKEWEKWIADNSVPEDLEMLEKNDTRIPSDSIVTDRVNTLKTTFARWLKARQDLAAALPKEQGDSYDYLTADMHSRMTGKLEAIIPYDNY